MRLSHPDDRPPRHLTSSSRTVRPTSPAAGAWGRGSNARRSSSFSSTTTKWEGDEEARSSCDNAWRVRRHRWRPSSRHGSLTTTTTKTAVSRVRVHVCGVNLPPRCPTSRLWKMALDPQEEASERGIGITLKAEQANAMFDKAEQANVIFDLPSSLQSFLWYHASAGWPPKETFFTEDRHGNYTSWPKPGPVVQFSSCLTWISFSIHHLNSIPERVVLAKDIR